jgi:hypothetical protein
MIDTDDGYVAVECTDGRTVQVQVNDFNGTGAVRVPLEAQSVRDLINALKAALDVME